MKKYFYWLIQQLKTFRSEEGFVKLLLNEVKFTEAECNNGPSPFEIERMGRMSSSLQGDGKNVSNYALQVSSSLTWDPEFLKEGFDSCKIILCEFQEKHDAEKFTDDDSIRLNGLPEESMDLCKHVQCGLEC